MSNSTIKAAFEAMLFVWGEPLEAKTAADTFNISAKDAYACFKELQQEYEERGSGLAIREVDKSFQIVTRPEYSEYIERLCTPVKEKRLSQSAMEVLAIIAYKQPVTRSEIESIRGIKSDRILEGLTRKDLIQEVGRSNAVGRPILYGTTRTFLEAFNFETIKDLPEIEDIAEVIRETEAPEENDAQTDDQQISIQL